MRTLIAIAAAALLAGCGGNVDRINTGSITAGDTLPSATVKIVRDNGHGSGIAIGNGYVLTAAHVAKGLDNAKLKLSNDTYDTAEVLWINTKYDVALLRTKARTATARLDCRTAKVGEAVALAGSPTNVEFVYSEGRIVGTARTYGPWPDALIVNAAIAPGMSGGAALDSNGHVIGINVGAQVLQMGFGGSLTGFGAIVPSSKVCELMARV